MNSQWKRLLLAAMISSSVFAATLFWYRATENKFSSGTNEKPVAYVGKVFDDIQRRPASRLLWQSIYNGEALFNGEAIRTSDKGEVRILFAGSDRYLDLEPESLIVIKKSEGEIALDLMEGSLFVNAKNDSGSGSAGGGLVLNSATGKVDLTDASASLSKGQGNRLDLQVLEGKASIQDKNGQSREINQGSSGALSATGMQFKQNALQILSPLPEKPVYMNAEDIKPVTFQWQGFPADTTVGLFWGDTRKDLKEIAKTSKPGEAELSSKVSLGKHYWKLVARNSQNQVIGESPIHRIHVIARYAPTLISPAADAEVPVKPGPNPEITFKWQTGEDTHRASLEVWADSSLKQKALTRNIEDDESFTTQDLKAGTYYWRVSGFPKGSDKPILGKIQKFSIFPSEKMRDPASVKKDIQVSWAGPETSQPQLYLDKPQVKVEWKAVSDPAVTSWKVSIHEENGNAVATKILPASELSYKAPVEKPGRYLASVEALNKNGDTLGTAQERAVAIALVPLIQGPKFISSEEILKADGDGRALLQWEKVDGAKDYFLTISKDGKEIKKARYTANETALRNLMPGEYQVEISAQDSHGRNSEIGDTRKLVVPDSSSLKAPKLKKIKVN